MSAEERAKDRQLQEDSDLRAVLATAEGRRVLWRIVSEYGLLHTLSYDVDDRSTSLREGRRAVGLSLWNECARVAPAHHVHMVTDALSRQQEERQLAEADSKRDE